MVLTHLVERVAVLSYYGHGDFNYLLDLHLIGVWVLFFLLIFLGLVRRLVIGFLRRMLGARCSAISYLRELTILAIRNSGTSVCGLYDVECCTYLSYTTRRLSGIR